MVFSERNNKIRNRYLEGVPLQEIADEYGLTSSCIYHITSDLPRRRNPRKSDSDYSFGVYPTFFQFRQAYGLSFTDGVRKIIAELSEEQSESDA